jgi:S-adenosylmethionine hydrolase
MTEATTLASMIETPLITLLTDFGLQDEYVGVMKGVIAGISPETKVVDISHQVDPQDIVHGAFLLSVSYAYFPSGSIHVTVVDPGVGGDRRILAVDCDGHFFVAPDNGILQLILDDRPVDHVVHVTNSRFFLNQVSRTFHGRDIFAPVAAHLAKGLPLTVLGPAVDRSLLATGVVPRCRFLSDGCLEGVVVAVDRFGNLMTNISESTIGQLMEQERAGNLVVELDGKSIGGLVATYDQAPLKAPLAIVGSRSYIEISVNCGNAQQALNAGKGSRVSVRVR